MYTYFATSSEMNHMDSLMPDSESELIKMASYAFFNTLIKDSIFQNVTNVLILCGKGNNGKDGICVGELLHVRGYNVYIMEAGKRERQYDIELNDVDLVIDAVFGTGFKGDLPGDTASLFRGVNAADMKRVSIDIPSGCRCDSATVAADTFKADLTITFEFLKAAHISYPAKEYCGRIITVPIGFTDEIRRHINRGNIYLTHDYFKENIKKRSDNTHKGTYGKSLCIAGSPNMTGAAYFAAMGTLRAGVGLLYIAAPPPVVSVLQMKLNEPVFLPLTDDTLKDINAYNSVCFGCGIERNDVNRDILRNMLNNYGNTLIIDADGINLLCENINILHDKKCEVILTPHPGEMSRLTGKSAGEIQSDRINTAKEFAEKHKCILILKGAATLVAHYDGRIAINSTGNPGMAKGGCGDILAGMTAGYAAQGYDAFTASCAAVYRHGLCGDICRDELSENGMLPTDILDRLARNFI